MTRALEQPPRVDTTTASDVAFLDVPDLLLNVASAAQLMTDRLDGLTSVDGYLLSAGIVQALEDSLYGYPPPLRSAVRRLSRSGRTRPAGLAEPAAARAWSARARLPCCLGYRAPLRRRLVRAREATFGRQNGTVEAAAPA